MKKKYPDNIVYDYKLEKFDANIKPYPTSVSAPGFAPIKVNKSTSINANHYFESKLNELRDEYKKLVEEYNWTKLVYESTYSFQPLIGHEYHLYKKESNQLFLSLIEPSQWDQEYVGTFKLLNNGKWEKI